MKRLPKLFIAFFLLGIAACDDPEPQEECVKPNETGTMDLGTLEIRITHKADSGLFQLNKQYTTAAGDQMDVETFSYYLSNFRLRDVSDLNDVPYREQNSYHLYRHDNQNGVNQITLVDVPAGSYNELEFGLGVDNAANASGDKIGELSPNLGMYWEWKTGYKFLEIEGKYLDSTGKETGYLWHIGENKNYKVHKIATDRFEVKAGQTTTLELSADVLDLYNKPTAIKLEDASNVMFSATTELIAEQYAQGWIKFVEVK